MPAVKPTAFAHKQNKEEGEKWTGHAHLGESLGKKKKKHFGQSGKRTFPISSATLVIEMGLAAANLTFFIKV
jgi:hypothetical protein